VGVVQQAVEHGGHCGDIAEQLPPDIDGPVRSDEGRGALVAAQWSPQQLLWAAAVAPAISTAVIVTLWLVLGASPKQPDAAEVPALAH